MLCKYCNKIIDNDSNYCKYCGNKVINDKEVKENWIECDSSLVRERLKLSNDKFKLHCTARGNKGEIFAYRKTENGQFEYCILENLKYKWINDNGYCKFYKLEE